MAISCQATALEIAHWLGGQLHGEDQLVIELVPLSHNVAGTLSFATHVPIHLKTSGVLLVREAFDGLNCITVPHPKWAMGELIRRFSTSPCSGVSPLADIHPTAVVDPTAVIQAGAVIGEGCTVGEKTRIGPHVVLYPKSHIGANCRIEAGAVIGASGFAYEQVDGRSCHIAHGGGVVIEDDVDIGAHVCIDQGMLDPTWIGSGVKIDNLVHIGHNTVIKSGTIIAAQTGVSGSARIGKGVLLGGQVGISNHAVLEDGVQVAAKSGVHGRLRSGLAYFGIPALPKDQAFKLLRALRRLPRWMQKQ